MLAHRLLTALVAGGALLALAAATAAPLLASHGRVEAVPLYLGLEFFCHQLPDRSWFFGDLQAGLCVRCFGLNGGVLLAAIGGFRFSRPLLAAGALTIALSWGVEALGLLEPASWTRFASGAVFGVAAGAMLAPDKPRRTSDVTNRTLDASHKRVH